MVDFRFAQADASLQLCAKRVSEISIVTPAKAGVQSLVESSEAVWIPAVAGMTVHSLDS